MSAPGLFQCLLHLLTFLIRSEQAFTGPTVCRVKNATCSLFHAGDGIHDKSFGDHAQGGMHSSAVFADSLLYRFIPIAHQVLCHTQWAEDCLYEVGIVANRMVD